MIHWIDWLVASFSFSSSFSSPLSSPFWSSLLQNAVCAAGQCHKNAAWLHYIFSERRVIELPCSEKRVKSQAIIISHVHSLATWCLFSNIQIDIFMLQLAHALLQKNQFEFKLFATHLTGWVLQQTRQHQHQTITCILTLISCCYCCALVLLIMMRMKMVLLVGIANHCSHCSQPCTSL